MSRTKTGFALFAPVRSGVRSWQNDQFERGETGDAQFDVRSAHGIGTTRRRTDALPCFRHEVFACRQIASMQYERIEMFADPAIREAMKNIFVSPPFGGGGATRRAVMEG